jgi:hypothetical protein
MKCLSCGRLIDEEEPRFCPHCGALLVERPSQAPYENTRPSQLIHEAPTRVSSGGSPAERGRWGDNYGQPVLPRDDRPTRSSFYHSVDPAAPEPRTGPASRLPASPTPTAPRPRRTGLLVAGMLLFALILAGGVGVVAYQFGLHQEQAAVKTAAATATRPAVPTATAVEQVVFSDPLTSPDHPWPQTSGYCDFQGGSYHTLKDYICFAPLGVYSDVNITVQVKQLTGAVDTLFGLVFRYVNTTNFYDFRITSNSLWIFDKLVNGKHTFILPQSANPAIQAGIGVVNTLRARIHGTHFQFFVNGTMLGQATDSTLASGVIGLYGPSTSQPTDIAWNNFQITTSNY